MTRKLTLFLVCAFEIGLILFVAGRTAQADTVELECLVIGQPNPLVFDREKKLVSFITESKEPYKEGKSFWTWGSTAFEINNLGVEYAISRFAVFDYKDQTLTLSASAQKGPRTEPTWSFSKYDCQIPIK
ncbi:hypothetical protein N9F22_05930 [Alphaproteobacteria bacterium]|jgi:hypothetical protein|nr:hypothetical protein [Alphaproteobacteria bacterium]